MKSERSNSICIIIPAFNEELGIRRCVEEIIKVIKKIPRIHLLIVNDGSTDKTARILASLKLNHRTGFSFITHKMNLGYGAALSSGVKKAASSAFTHVIFMDSDLTNKPSDISRFYHYLDNNNIDCVKASRYLNGGKMKGVPYKRQVISKIGNLITAHLFDIGIKDCTNGFRMVRLELIKNHEFKENNYSIILEELYYLKKKNAKIIEIPITLTSRTDSTTNFKYTLRMFWDYFKYALMASLI